MQGKLALPVELAAHVYELRRLGVGQSVRELTRNEHVQLQAVGVHVAITLFCLCV